MREGWICICLWLAQLSATKRPQRIGGVLVKSADWCAITIEYIYINYIRMPDFNHVWHLDGY